MENKNTATTRPADPSKISFSPECFETIGSRTEYVVVLSAPNYPRTFTSLDEAEAFAAKRGRAVSTSEVPVTRRVRWF